MPKHSRPRNVPPPDPDGVGRKVRARPGESIRPAGLQRFQGAGRAPDPDGVDREGHDRGRNVHQGLPRGRVKGTNGSWPAHGVAEGDPPKPPAICALYPDLLDPRDLPEPIFGQYPKSLIPKLLPWLRCERREVLHVCSGALPPGEGIRVDIRPEARPDILADGRRLPLPDGSVKAVMIDPPYTPQYARDLYGLDYPRPSQLLAEAARVVVPAGRIIFVHYLVPLPPKGAHHIKCLGLSTGFGFPMRAVTIFQRDQASLF